MKISNIVEYHDWLIVPIKTNPMFVTYSFVLISFDDKLFHIEDRQYQSILDAVSVGRKMIDLEETRISARPMP